MDAWETAELPLLLAMAFNQITDEVNGHLAREGHGQLRTAHGFALGRLVRGGGDATIATLAGHLGMTKQGAAQLVAELENWGYVRREPHPTDGRSRIIVATERGVEVVRRVADLWNEIERRWSDTAGTDEVAAVRVALRRFLAASDGPCAVRPIW